MERYRPKQNVIVRPRLRVEDIIKMKDETYIKSVFFYKGGSYHEGKSPRYDATLFDETGNEIEAIIWRNNFPATVLFDYDDKFIAWVEGMKNTYRGKEQIIIFNVEMIPPSDEEFSELTNVFNCFKQKLSELDKDAYEADLKNLIDSVNNKYYHKLLVDLFTQEMVDTFRNWTAAWERHHAYPGGLLVHTVNVAKKCSAIASVSPYMDRELLITAALLHDIAKTREYSGFPLKRRLYIGRMLFHAYMGAEMVGIQIHEYRTSGREDHLAVSDFPENLEIQLKHCILSHHGKPEYGAAVKPMILEAHILHLMDTADADEAYFKEHVIDDPDITADIPTENVSCYYDNLYKDYAYPTLKIEEYHEYHHEFDVLGPLPGEETEEELPF